MAENTSSDIMIQIGTQLDDKGLKTLNAELAKTGMVASKNADTGKLSFQKMGDSAKSAGDSFAKAALKLTAWYMAAQKAITGAVDKAKADKQLELAVKNNTDAISRQGKSVKELTKEFIDYADAREKATNIDDAATEALQRMILAAGEAPQNVNRVVEAFQDLEAASGISAESMSRAWARMAEDPSEALGALSKAGVMIDKQSLEGLNAIQQKAVILDQIEKKYEGQALSAAEATGSVGRFGVAMDNLFESMGKIVITVITPFLDGLGKISNLFAEMPGWLQAAVLGIGGLATAVYMAGGSFTALGAAVKGFFVSLGPIGWAIAGVTALVGVIGLFSGSGASIKDVTQSIDELDATMEKSRGNKAYADNMNKLLEKLKGLEQGTDDYKSTAESLLGSNDALKKSNLSVANSYVDIANKVRDVIGAVADVDAFQLLNDTEKAFDNAKDAYSEIARLDRRRQGPNGLSRADESKYQALLTTVARMRLSLEQADALLGNEAGAPGSYSTRLVDYIGGLNMSGTPGASIQTRYDAIRLRREQLANNRNSYTSGGGGGGDGGVAAHYDLMKLKLESEQKLLDLKLHNNELAYEDEKRQMQASVEWSNMAADERLNAEAALRTKYNDLADAERKASLDQFVSEVGDGLSTGFSVGTSVIKGDWKAAIGETLSTINPTLSAAFSGAVHIFGTLMGRTTKSEAEKLADRLKEAVAAYAEAMNDVKVTGDVEGEDSTITTAKRIKETKDALAKNPFGKLSMDAALEKYNMYANANLDRTGFEDLFDPMKTKGYGVDQIKAYFKKVYGDGANEVMIAMGIMDAKTGKIWEDKWRTQRMSLAQFNAVQKDVLAQAIEWMRSIKDDEMAKALADDADELERISNEEKLSRISAEEAKKQRLAVIDASIKELKSLEQTKEVKAAILKLEADRLDILNDQNAAQDQSAMTEKQRLLSAKAAALADDIKYGRASNNYANNAQLQSYYTELLTSMKASGLFGTAVYKEVEDQLMALVKSNIGEGGYAAASGTGSNAVFGSTIPTRNQYNPVIQVDGRNTNSSQVIINAPLNMPPDIVPWFLRIAQTQSGRGL